MLLLEQMEVNLLPNHPHSLDVGTIHSNLASISPFYAFDVSEPVVLKVFVTSTVSGGSCVTGTCGSGPPCAFAVLCTEEAPIPTFASSMSTSDELQPELGCLRL